MRRRFGLVAFGLCLLAAQLLAQEPVRDAMARALELERQSSYAAAVEAYRAVLSQQPGDPAALLGLERVLEPLQRQAEIIPLARAAAAVAPGGAVFGVLVRAWVASGQQDSARDAVEQWASTAPGDPQPWRDWVQASMRQRDRVSARGAVELARRQLKDPRALAFEMAQLRAAEGDWPAAAQEWLMAVHDQPGYRVAASAALAPAPVAVRPRVLATLQQDSSLDAQVLAAVLEAGWGAPEQAVRGLIGRLPARNPKAVDALTGFAEQLRGRGSRAALIARGIAFEEIARRTVGVAVSRALVSAAQSYQEAGDTESARRVLSLVSENAPAGGDASETMIDVLVAAGRMKEAEDRFQVASGRMSTEDRDVLRRRLAWGWARTGDFDRAAARLAGDSTVEGLALRGRIAIFQGDLKDGAEMLRKAGPFAGSRQAATDRTTLLALLQPIQAESLPALGAALLTLEQGDTTAAAASLETVARSLPPDAGGADLHLLAGQLVHASGDRVGAERLLRAADSPSAPAVAPVAELELARLMLAGERRSEAQSMLEHLILAYPSSAVVPEARRALDELKGAVPAS